MKALHSKLARNYLKQDILWAKFAKSRFKVGLRGSPIWNCISKHVKVPEEVRQYYANIDFVSEGNRLIWIDACSGVFSSKS